jgi:nucleotide-binding universal stress UspA family protein
VRRIPTTVLHLDDAAAVASPAAERRAERATAAVRAAVQAGDEAAATPTEQVDVMTRSGAPGEPAGAIATEARKGYGLLVIGREPTAAGSAFDPQITRSAVRFAGSFAIAVARARHRGAAPAAPLNILVPVSGTRVSRQGAEVAIALTQASRGSVTALYVATDVRFALPWRQRFGRALAPRHTADAAIREVVELGRHYDIAVNGRIRTGSARPNAILREIQSGQHDLLVMGVSPRTGGQLFFGEVPAEILERAPCSLLFVSADPAAPTASTLPARALREHA